MIDVRDLTKSFALPGGGVVHAVDGVSFRVAPGEVYGLLGPNGAGKTTTIRMILGLLRSDRGYAEIAGFRSDRDPQEVKRHVGVVAAHAGVYPSLTVRETLHFFADCYGVPLPDARAEIARLSEVFGIAPLLDRACGSLSTGQRQRVQLARALVHRPPALLLDEPTVGVDIIGSQVVVEYLELLRRDGKAVIFCTHRLEEAERLCGRFGLLHQGRIVAEGTLAELRAQTGREDLTAMFLQLAGIASALQENAA